MTEKMPASLCSFGANTGVMGAPNQAKVGRKVMTDSQPKLHCIHEIQIPSSKVLAVAFSPDGNLLAAGDREGFIHIIDTQTGEVVRKLKQHVEFVYALAFDVDSGYLISTGKDRSLRVWKAETGQFIRDDAGIFLSATARSMGAQMLKPTTRSHNLTILSLATAPGGLMATASQDKNVKLWRHGEPLRSFSWHEGPVTCVRFQPEHGILFSASKDRSIRSWDAQNGAMISKYLGHRDEIVGFAFSSADRFVSADLAGEVLAWQVDKSSAMGSLYTANSQVQSLAITPDGETLYLGLEDGSLVVLDIGYDIKARAREPRLIDNSHSFAIRSIDVSADGRIASSDNAGKVFIHSLA